MKAYDVILIDSMSLLHRAAHSYATLGFLGENGTWVFTGPVFGFLTMAIGVWEKYASEGCEVYFCWDAGYQHRLDLYPEYKANRRQKASPTEKEPTSAPEESRADLKMMESALRRLLYVGGFRQAVAKGYEADDVLATLGARFGDSGRVALYTIDQDLHQSVTDSVHVVSSISGKDKIWTPAEVVEKWGLPPDRVAEMKGLIGDGGDNIPGCPGCGMGWAQKMFAQYGDVRRIIAASKAGPKPLLRGELNGKKWQTPSLTSAISANEQNILVSWELAKVVRDAPVIINSGSRDEDKFTHIMSKLRFYSLLEGDKWATLEKIRG